MKFKLLLLVLSVLIAAGLVAASPDFQQATRFRSIFVEHDATIAGTLDMDNGAISNIGAAGTDFGSNGSLTTAAGVTVSSGGLTVTAGGATITAGGLTLSDGDAAVADFAQITAQTAISVTDGGIITPTGSYQQLESAGAVTATLSSGCTAGRQVVLVNTANQTIVVSETATSALSGNASLGQYDAMDLLCDGTRWVQIAPESDN